MGYFVCVEPSEPVRGGPQPRGKKTSSFLHGWPFSHEQFEYQSNVLPAKVR